MYNHRNKLNTFISPHILARVSQENESKSMAPQELIDFTGFLHLLKREMNQSKNTKSIMTLFYECRHIDVNYKRNG